MVLPEHAKLVAAARAAARAIRPVTRVKDGSGRLKQEGTAFILGNEHERLVVTAEHVVAGPEPAMFGVSREGSLPWPRRYKRLVTASDQGPHADVAYFFAELGPTADENLAAALPLATAVRGLQVEPGMSLLAVGYPESKAKFRDAQTRLSNKVMSVVTQAKSREVYADLGLDPAVFIATHYDAQALLSLDGGPSVGSDPHGMSGGVLFLPVEQRVEGGEHRVLLFVAGVLIQHRPTPQNTLISTRIDCLLDAVAPHRLPAERRYRAADA